MVKYQIGVDIGGTFTDVAVISDNGTRAILGKSPSTPANYLEGVVAALENASSQLGYSIPELLEQSDLFSHSTTITSNVLWTRSGPRVGLITTRGFADQILIMRGIGRVAGLSLAERRHYRRTEKPKPIVPRWRIREVAERVDSTGEIIVPFDKEEIKSVVQSLVEEEEIESLAVGLLWSFRNPSQERGIYEIAKTLYPNLPISLSSDVSGRLGEYERTATAVLNAYVSNAMQGYLEQLKKQLKELGFNQPPLIVQSDGGLIPAEHIVPVRTVESGPAIGVVGAARLAEEMDRPNLIATDVGGTTFKVSLIQEGTWELADETVLNQYHVHVPMVDVVSIGAGGGSIAWVDEGRLQVGPRSAGAIPGPACYAQGGKDPTVTDADLLLGVLNPNNFLGGRIKLNEGAAKRAFELVVAPTFFGGDVMNAAAGIREIIDAQMADLIRRETLERGRDIREFSLLAYGGAGPAHACTYAAEVGINEVIVPYQATVLSAHGAAAAGVRYTLERSLTAFVPDGVDTVEQAYYNLEREGEKLLSLAGVPEKNRRFERWCTIRWRRQVHSIRLPFLGNMVNETTLLKTAESFSKIYETRYGKGSAYREAGVEITQIGLNALGPSQSINKNCLPSSLKKANPIGERQVFWPSGGGWSVTPIYDGPTLSVGTELNGPCVIEHPGTTIALPPMAKSIIDKSGHTHISLSEDKK